MIVGAKAISVVSHSIRPVSARAERKSGISRAVPSISLYGGSLSSSGSPSSSVTLATFACTSTFVASSAAVGLKVSIMGCLEFGAMTPLLGCSTSVSPKGSGIVSGSSKRSLSAVLFTSWKLIETVLPTITSPSCRSSADGGCASSEGSSSALAPAAPTGL